jgi:hypothetical protein
MLLLYVLTAWVVLSIPAGLFLGCMFRAMAEDPFDQTARTTSTQSRDLLTNEAA